MEASDDELLLRVGRGDGEACRALVERHLPRILAFAARVLGNPADAEDVAQETFTRAWTHAAAWRPGPARFTTWLHTVALNLCRDRRARRREAPLDSVAEPPDPAPTAAARLAEADVSRRVAREIAALPDRQREALALCHYQDLTNAEAAVVMDVGVEAIESLLARARRTLRARLRPVAGELLEGMRGS